VLTGRLLRTGRVSSGDCIMLIGRILGTGCVSSRDYTVDREGSRIGCDNSGNCILSTGKVIGTGCFRKRPWCNTPYYPGICFAALRKITPIPILYSRFLDKDWNLQIWIGNASHSTEGVYKVGSSQGRDYMFHKWNGFNYLPCLLTTANAV
jgi:hypothetical protein